MSQLVTHVTQAFLPLSEAWMYDLITAPISYERRVLTFRRQNEEQFPYDRVELLDQLWRRGSAPWVHGVLHDRLGWPRTPANSWKKALRRTAAKTSIFHAHFGPVGWRVVDAGLSPVVTSFYGFDVSEAFTLSEWRSAYRRLFGTGSAFIVLGPAMRERLVALGAPAERTHVVPLIAILTDDWAAASVEESTPPRVLMSGRLVEKKGFVDGVAAFAEVRRAGIDARLVIMGSGPEEERIHAAVQTHGLDRDVDFMAPLPRRRFREYLSSCQIFLQPSRTASDGDSEGTPATILDAQSLGRVVVTTRHADIPEVVDPKAAFLAPEGDVDALTVSLMQALSNTDEWPARGRAGRLLVETRHSPARVAGLLERLYDEVTLGAASR